MSNKKEREVKEIAAEKTARIARCQVQIQEVLKANKCQFDVTVVLKAGQVIPHVSIIST